MSDPKERSAEYYSTAMGRVPFRDWRFALTDKKARIAIDARITRLRAGAFGDSKALGDGVFEYRIDFQGGYRIYYAVNDDEIVLLCGGDKKTQASDIAAAKDYLTDHRRRVWAKKKN